MGTVHRNEVSDRHQMSPKLPKTNPPGKSGKVDPSCPCLLSRKDDKLPWNFAWEQGFCDLGICFPNMKRIEHNTRARLVQFWTKLIPPHSLTRFYDTSMAGERGVVKELQHPRGQIILVPQPASTTLVSPISVDFRVSIAHPAGQGKIVRDFRPPNDFQMTLQLHQFKPTFSRSPELNLCSRKQHIQEILEWTRECRLSEYLARHEAPERLYTSYD